MSTKKMQGNRIPRINPTETYPRVGEAAEKLKAVIPVFGEDIVSALVNAVASGQVRHGELELTSQSNPLQIVKVVFDNTIGSHDLKIQMSGSWDASEISLDTPLFSPVNGIVYRKRQREDENPIAEEGARIEPGGAICAISQTKSNIWYLELPPDSFPKGSILTKFVIPDGGEVKKDEIICYVKKIE